MQEEQLKMKQANSINAEKEGNELKAQGNNAFRQGDFKTALNLYSRAIETYPNEPTFYLNRAKAFKNLNSFV